MNRFKTLLRCKFKLSICFGAVIILWYSLKLFEITMYQNNLLPQKQKNFTIGASHDDWYSMTSNIHLYSAYWDTRNKQSLVRLIAIGLRLKDETNLQCAFKYDDTVTYSSVRKEVLLEHWFKKHSAVFYLCVPPRKTCPDYVTLITNSTRGQWKKVRTTRRTSSKVNMAVCVRPLFGPFNDTLKLAEFLSYYDIMDVTRFTFYDFNTSTSSKDYLSRLKEGRMDVQLLPWTLPSKLDVWEMGQLAFIQDCIYRHMSEFEFVLILDNDELIVPKRSKTLKQLASKTKSDTGCYVFRNSFFCDTNKRRMLQSLDLRSEYWNMREDLVWPAPKRSKLMIRTRAVVSSGIHEVQRFVKGFRKVVVDPGEFLLHHYRDAKCNKRKKLIKDWSVIKFVDVMKSSLSIKSWLQRDRGRT